LYATTSGAPYERSELGSIEDPNWPNGSRRLEVRLLAEDGTVVEQFFTLERDTSGDWVLEPESEVLENGQALPALSDILGGEVTFQVDPSWESFFGPRFEINGKPADLFLWRSDGYIQLLADPLPVVDGCNEGPAPADAAALAETIVSDPDFESTTPTATTIGGVPALQMDVVNNVSAGVCDGNPRSAVTTVVPEPGNRMRLYLVDLPGGSARILSIAVVAPESSFETVVEQVAPVLDSFEFHTG
jgi:hypothetical protein